MIGPVLHYWYGINASIAPGAGTGAALVRLAMDQLFFAPPFVALNFAVLKVLEVCMMSCSRDAKAVAPNDVSFTTPPRPACMVST